MTTHVFFDANDNILGAFISKEQVKGNQDYFKIRYNSGTSLLGFIKSILTNKQYHREHINTYEIENKGIEGQYDIITIGYDPSKPSIFDRMNFTFSSKNENLLSQVKSLKLQLAGANTRVEEQSTSVSSAIASMKKTVHSRDRTTDINPMNGLNRPGAGYNGINLP